ncbi:MAG: hypothetical protein ACTHK7_21175 [Aureliella sp.]
MLSATSGCAPLRPRAIEAKELLLSPQLKDDQPQVQRGKPRKVIDAAGWIVGIPDKLLLWNRRIDNHNIGPRTEEVVSEYLAVNGLETTRVRLNQYAPLDDWRRLVRNKRVGAPWRYTFGTVTLLYETALPGRVFGGDHYNPYTDTVHLYSDVPAVALHEAGHAKDFARRKWKGTYAAAYILPGVPLYHESIATDDALAFAQMYATPAEQREAYNVLYPAYGTYAGSAAGTVLPIYSTPLYYGAVVGGHVWGRALSRSVPDEEEVTAVETSIP